jgi:hypothetical protein
MNITVLDLAILSLAAYRIVRLITTDYIFNPIRERIWRWSKPDGVGIGYLITCEWCMGLWVASGLVGMYTIASETTVVVSCVFAISAVVGLLYRID